jgi:hypothetical protein
MRGQFLRARINVLYMIPEYLMLNQGAQGGRAPCVVAAATLAARGCSGARQWPFLRAHTSFRSSVTCIRMAYEVCKCMPRFRSRGLGGDVLPAHALGPLLPMCNVVLSQKS